METTRLFAVRFLDGMGDRTEEELKEMVEKLRKISNEYGSWGSIRKLALLEEHT